MIYIFYYTSIIKHLNETQYDQETLVFLKYLIYLKSYYIIQITKNGEINVRFVLGNKIGSLDATEDAKGVLIN